MFRYGSIFRRTQRRGQALLVAVLLMMLILLTGVLFVAIVSYNQHQSVRTTDVSLAQSLAEAGVQWCNQNLMKSPQGADWRPPFKALDTGVFSADPDTWPVPPVMNTNNISYGAYGLDQTEDTEDDYYSDFERARGWHGLVDANTGEYIRQGFYRLPDINSTPASVTLPTEAGAFGGKGHILVRVSYDPDPPYETPASDPVRQPDEMSGNIKIESIGVVDDEVPVYRYLVAYKPLALTDYALFVTDNGETGRPVKLGFNPNVDMDNNGNWAASDRLNLYLYGPLRFNSTLQLNGFAAGGQPSTYITLTGQVDPQGEYVAQPTINATEVAGMNPVTVNGGYLRVDRLEVTDSITEPYGANTTMIRTRAADGSQANLSVLLPSSNAAYSTQQGRILDGFQGFDGSDYSRYTAPLTPPKVFTGSGRGADRYRSLTRDSGEVRILSSGEAVNLGNYGFGRGIYVDNKSDMQFVSNTGVHDLDSLIAEWMQVFPQGQYSAENSGWNPTYTTYTAPGVQITLYPTEAAALEFGNLTRLDDPSIQAGTVWWPGHVAGEPGIRLTRSDRTWQRYNPLTDAIEDSGETSLYLDYPNYPNQVIFTEGNARVHGVLPIRNSGGVARDYNLTIVSGGTIYIDGQLLSPQDVDGRDPGSGVPLVPGGPVPDEYNSKVALIARDSVCLNTTRLAGQFTSGEISAAPDDPYNPKFDEQHFELSPEVLGAAYTQFVLGEAPLAGQRIGLAAIHTASDPGPAAISMNVFDSNAWNRYQFGAVAPLDPLKFYFIQSGILAAVSRGNVERLLAPDWSQPGSPADPIVPWDLTAYLGALTPSFLKSVAINYADPDLGGVGAGAGATEYWLKKWKIHETDPAGNPTGAIHAKINALIYAETGCWFVIPGRYFDDRQIGASARAFRRYNYDIAVRGCITEAFHAEPEMVREWADKWAWPTAAGGWATIRYEYDESIRNTRDPRAQRVTTLSGATRYADAASAMLPSLATPSELSMSRWNMPIVPCLPVSEDLIFYGEAQ